MRIENMRHTPRPWAYRPNSRQRILNRRDYVELCGPGSNPLGIYAFLRPGEPEDDIETGNFHYLLKAINVHEEMLEALKATLEEWHSDDRNFERREPKSLVLVRQAIAKAEGGKR